MMATSAIRAAIVGERCSRVIFGEKVEMAFCRSFRTAAAAAAAAAALRECIPIGLGYTLRRCISAAHLLMVGGVF